MLSDDTLDSIRAGKHTSLGVAAILKLENDTVGMLFNLCQALTKSDVLNRYEASHDFEQRLPVCLLYVSCSHA